MTAEKEIILADREEALAILGEGDEFLRVIEAGANCQVRSRGLNISLSGDETATEGIATLLTELQFLHRQGARLTRHEVRYGLKLAGQGKAAELHDLFGDTVLVNFRGKHIRPKTLGQKLYLETIRRSDITFGIGPAGTGKTYLAVVLAVAALRTKAVSRLILTRPAVEAGERLGFLPGDMQEKVDPYLRPLYDALQDTLGLDMYQKFLGKGIIEIAPLAYMRGRTLENAFIILDEAQNTTHRQMKMFLTRLGFGSRMVITGDVGQIDLPKGVSSGLVTAEKILQGVKGVGIVRLDTDDVIRHDVVSRIVAAYDSYEAMQP
ncbi:MAG: PhoH family protein [Selenomonadaceae bacterium]|nr:PhoH family protein [Selenomonadaceae bacterium]